MSKSNVIALTLAGLAVVMAATGTAVAVTATQVNIADPVTPSRIARVDSSGRLGTINALSPYTYGGIFSNLNGENNFITAPTTASLALTSLTLTNPKVNQSATAAELRVYLYKANSSSTSSCTPTTYQSLGAWNLAPGNSIVSDLPSPLLTKASGTSTLTPYCLSLYAYALSGSFNGNYYPTVAASWYVASGTYKGPGAAGSLKTPAQVQREARTDR